MIRNHLAIFECIFKTKSEKYVVVYCSRNITMKRMNRISVSVDLLSVQNDLDCVGLEFQFFTDYVERSLMEYTFRRPQRKLECPLNTLESEFHFRICWNRHSLFELKRKSFTWPISSLWVRRQNNVRRDVINGFI